MIGLGFCSVFVSSSGADDLLPILSYVALRSELPQLVSECAALEEFIHEGWVPEIQYPLILQYVICIDNMKALNSELVEKGHYINKNHMSPLQMNIGILS